MTTYVDFFPILFSIIWSETFWTAVGAIGSIVALLFIYKQIRDTANVTAYQFLRNEDDRFRSLEFRTDRSNLARTLLQQPGEYQELESYADYVLDYFEDMGIILRNNLAPASLIWAMSCYYILNYWAALSPYIK